MALLKVTEHGFGIGDDRMALGPGLVGKVPQKQLVRSNDLVGRPVLVIVHSEICRVGPPVLGVVVVCGRKRLFVQLVEQVEVVHIDFRPSCRILAHQKIIDAVRGNPRLADRGGQQMGPNDIACYEVTGSLRHVEKFVGVNQCTLIAHFLDTDQVPTLADRRHDEVGPYLELSAFDRLWNTAAVDHALTHPNSAGAAFAIFDQTDRHNAVMDRHPFSQGIIHFLFRSGHLRAFE